MRYFLLTLTAVLADQLTKQIVQAEMELSQSIPVIHEIFHLTLIHNYGAAFSMLQGKAGLLAVGTGIAILAVLAFMWLKRNTAHPCLMTAMALIAGGGLGNLIDRMVLGYVVDFLDLRIWPVFNVADVCVCCGCGLLILYVLVLEPRQKKKALEVKELES